LKRKYHNQERYLYRNYIEKKMKLKTIFVLIIIFLLIGMPSTSNLFSKEDNIEKAGRSSLSILSYAKGSGCKLVMAIANATAGNYNLLMKVRDPARPGLQVLCPIPKGYEYEYHHPWFGFKMHFKVRHKFIGTTTVKDIPPNITKPGMILNDAGIAIADADTLSYLVNPSKYAWDDFDWMRYAIQSADNIDEAISLLTHDAVDKLHATSVAENMFVVGIDKGAIIEADAFNYRVKGIKDGIAVQSNYPKMLWNIHLLYPLFTASQFNSTFTGWVEKGKIIRLGGLMGIHIVKISSNSITARLFPFGLKKEIFVGEGRPIGNFWLRLLDINGSKAKIFLCFKYYEWERKMENIIEKRIGNITVKDMMAWSRIHSNDLEGLRGMCQGGYEAATVYKIPKEYPEFLSTLWFATDQCASIFVPVHIGSLDIYDAYENGGAHSIALQLLEKYGHDNLTSIFEKVEAEFINETEEAEIKAIKLLQEGKQEEAMQLLTLSDMNMQMRAIAIEKMWLNASYLSNEAFAIVYPELIRICKEHANVKRINNAIDYISTLMKENGIDISDKIYLKNIEENLQELFRIILNHQTFFIYN